MPKKKIKVLIIDDSALVRKILSSAFENARDIEVLGTAMDPLFAVEIIRAERPDVITLDIQMPRMDGLTFLKKLMSSYPIPVVVISSLTKQGSEAAIKALQLGAVDVVAKPDSSIEQNLSQLSAEITDKVRLAASSNIQPLITRGLTKSTESTASTASTASTPKTPKDQKHPLVYGVSKKLVVLGASTGGTVAVRKIIENVEGPAPAMLVVLHMPAHFTYSYAEGINKGSSFTVKEAANGDVLLNNHIYIAPGGYHVEVKKASRGYRIHLNDDPPYNRHKPAIDLAFFSAAAIIKECCFAAVLTGMGNDGAEGLKAILESGGTTVTQNEETSVIYGMPKQALMLGGSQASLSLYEIAEAIQRFSQS